MTVPATPKTLVSSGVQSADSTRPTRLQIGLWFALAVFTLFLSLSDYSSTQVGTERDDAAYITLARSLLESTHFGLINQPGPPGESQFPFGYPLVLAPLLFLFPHNWDALKILSLAATIANGAILFWGWSWFSRRSYWWGLAVATLYLISPLTIGQTRMVLPEPIFTTCYLIAAILAVHATRAQPGLLWILLMSVNSVFLVFTRTVGWVIWESIVLILLCVRGKRVWKQMVGVVSGMLIILVLLIPATPVGRDDIFPILYVVRFFDYVSGAAVSRAIRNTPFPIRLMQDAVIHFRSDIPSAVLPIGGGVREQQLFSETSFSFLPDLIRLALFALICIGFAKWFRKEGPSIFMLSSLTYLGALFLWIWIGPRLLYPILPQLFLACLWGIEACIAGFAHRLKITALHRFVRVGMVLVAGGLAALFLYKSWNIDHSELHVGDLADRTAWVKENTSASAVIMSKEPEVDFLYSNRHTISFPVPRVSEAEFADYLKKHPVDYALVAPTLEWQNSYSPGYDNKTKQILIWLERLTTENRAFKVYSVGSQSIQVFKIAPALESPDSEP